MEEQRQNELQAGPVPLDTSTSVFEQRVYEGWRKPELVKECRDRGLPATGNRDKLTERLRESDAVLQEEAILEQYEASLRDPKLVCAAHEVTLLHRTKVRSWHAEYKGKALTIQTGKIGEKQRTTITKFKTPAEAQKGFRDRIRKKLKEGFYRTSPWSKRDQTDHKESRLQVALASASNSASTSGSSSSTATNAGESEDMTSESGESASQSSSARASDESPGSPGTTASNSRRTSSIRSPLTPRKRKKVSFCDNSPQKRLYQPFEVLVLDKKLTVAKLRESLKLHGLDTKGKKDALLNRLREHVNSNPTCQATKEDLDHMQVLQQQS